MHVLYKTNNSQATSVLCIEFTWSGWFISERYHIY